MTVHSYDFTVVVKHYRRPYLLALCLESLQRYWPRARFNYRVVIADDGSDPVVIDAIYSRMSTMYDWMATNPRGCGKWALARDGRFAEVAHTCGETWNQAMSVVGTEYVFVIEDDSRLIAPSDPIRWIRLLERDRDLMCVIGLDQRVKLERAGFGTVTGVLPDATQYTHPNWPWSFDSILFRRSDWAQIGPWPVGPSTALMEDWLTGRLREVGFINRPYVVPNEPWSRIDETTRVRVDPPDVAAGAASHRVYRHADALLRAWLDRSWVPAVDGEHRMIVLDGLRPEDWK